MSTQSGSAIRLYNLIDGIRSELNDFEAEFDEALERIAALDAAIRRHLSKAAFTGCHCNPPGAGGRRPEDPLSYDSGGGRCTGDCYLREALAEEKEL